MEFTFAVRFVRRLATAGLLVCSAAPAAVSHVPASDAEVLQRVAPASDGDERALRAERTALAEHPDELATATAYARHALALGRARGDARLVGQAQAALAPWWSQAAPPREVWLLRATILQNRHAFAEALSDLDGLLAQDPGDAQARLTRATVRSVQARYLEALSDCAHLFGSYGALVQAACSATPLSLDGRAAAAAQLIDTLLPMSTAESADVLIWAQTLSAELAQRRGDTALAAQRYAEALQRMDRQPLPDPYLLACWADFALDHGDAPAVVQRLRPQLDNDVLALRLAAALQITAPDEAEPLIERLGDRLAAADARGEHGQAREQAWYWLRLRHDAARALPYARDNWTRQREPIDAQLLMQTALAAAQPRAAQAALDWYRSHHVQDASLASLVEQLTEAGA